MRRDAVVIGASAGGVEALRTIMASLPADVPASVLVVLHVPPYGGSALPAILDRAERLPARHAAGEHPLVPGEVLVRSWLWTPVPGWPWSTIAPPVSCR